MAPARLACGFAAAVMLLSGCGRAEPGATLTAEPVGLNPAEPEQVRVGALLFRGGLVLEADDERFGGFSALEISADGNRLLAISDRGAWMALTLAYDADGALSDAGALALFDMLDEDGRPLNGAHADAEGLAALDEGRYAVSFERNHRMLAYTIGADWSALESARAEPLQGPPNAERLRNNAGLEALAVLDAEAGGLWVGVELPLVDGQPHTLWRLTDQDQSARAVRLEPGFGLTALNRIPADAPQLAGALIVVERFWSRDIGNRIRISVLPETSGPAGPDLAGEPRLLAELTPDLTVDNFEAVGAAVIDGETRIILLSDDNFSDSQRTLLLSFAIAETD